MVSSKTEKLVPLCACNHESAITNILLMGPGVLQCLIKYIVCATPCSQYNCLNASPPNNLGPFLIANGVEPQYPLFLVIECNDFLCTLSNCVFVKWEVAKACTKLG